ncbi:lamin-B receptor [Anopheles bellator]|uniref:lamin-B receptor n=1 Tax=Anopheles bellator TaxID=139047 RepID=UPI002649988C|nr:lamin-B receptor [Anopheles bellator]
MDSRRGKRMSLAVGVPANTATVESATDTMDRKKPGRKTLTTGARKASPGRKPSPGRKASPARRTSPARKASPARRASPGRKPKATTTAVPLAPATVKPPPVEPVKVSPVMKDEPRRSERIRASEDRSEKGFPMMKKSPTDKRLSVILDDSEVSDILGQAKDQVGRRSVTPNTSQRTNAATPTTTTERSRQTHSMSALAEYSDNEDDDADYKSFRRTEGDNNNGVGMQYADATSLRHQQQLVEFGGPVRAALLALVIPLFAFFTNHFCSGAAHRDCRFMVPKNWDEFCTLSTYFNREVAMFYLLYLSGVALLTALPTGRVVRLAHEARPERAYTFNGLLVALGTGLGVFVAEYCYKYPLLSVVSRGYNQLLVLSLVGALLASVLAYVKTRYTEPRQMNHYACTGRMLYDMFAGRDVNPTLLNVFNLKLITYHVSVVLALLFNGIILYRNLHFTPLPESLVEGSLQERLLFTVRNVTGEPAPLTAAALTMLYLLDLLVYEHHLAASFELQQEGFGTQYLLRQALFPFMLTLLPKYVAAHKLSDVPIWALAVCATVALVGLVVKRSAQRIKYLYRLDPLGKKVVGLQTYPTYQGRRLLVAHGWRFVRQPNYVGDILQTVALLPLLYWRFAWPPLLAALFTVCVLAHRAKRLSARNHAMYDSPWFRYCNAVPALLVPRVF